jgi:hypothetical protein
MPIVGWRPSDVLADTADKSLVSRLWVEPDVVDPVRLIEWATATGVSLSDTYLRGAYLQDANLQGAHVDDTTVLPDGWRVVNGRAARVVDGGP